DQAHRTATSAPQAAPRTTAFGGLGTAACGAAEIVTIALQQIVERPQVVRQTAENLFLLQLVGHGDLHRAVEGQLARMDAAQNLDRVLHDVIAFEQAAAEAPARELDFLCQGNFLLPRK